MKKAVTAILIVLALAASAGAADKPLTPQQERMKSCNADATSKGVKGDARKQFMSHCLKGEATASTDKTLTPQQEKMKDCNAQATSKGVKGEARKTFMSSCLKGS